MGSSDTPTPGITGQPRGHITTYTARTIPAIGSCVAAITRTLDEAAHPLAAIEVRAFRADAQQREHIPAMPEARLLDHPGGLGIIRCTINAGIATSTCCTVAGASLDLRRYYATSGVMAWMLETLEAELAVASITSIHIPLTTLVIESDAAQPDMDAWARDTFTAHSYQLNPEATAFEITLDRTRTPRQHA